ncbi:MAG TPA: TetR/AcrR family transcriptional regulator [Kofleriaceae bacterium]|nr:TetR/AcrR family transcriptional regulator [Kofleriaceae bacterium]
MVQKSDKSRRTEGSPSGTGRRAEGSPSGTRRRGRPPAYDRELALERALDAFWKAGYAATSLDDLSAATGMNRPSLYGAFGDKRDLYLLALEHYRASSRAGVARALAPERSLREGLAALYAGALSRYLAGERGGRGCFLVSTATTEAVASPEVRAVMAESMRELDQAFEARLRLAAERGELPAGADPKALARLAQAVLHTLAIRARAGEERAVLDEIAASGVDLICGPARSAARRR